MADPARLLASHDLQPVVEYRTFVVADVMADPLADPVPDGDWINHPEPGGVVFGLSGNDFFPSVALEVSSAVPPPDPGPWDAVEKEGLDLRGGEPRVRAILGQPAGPDLTVGAGRFRPRAHCGTADGVGTTAAVQPGGAAGAAARALAVRTRATLGGRMGERSW